MSATRSLLINAIELLREPGSRKHVSTVVTPIEIDAEHPAVTGDVAVEVDLESTLDDIGLTGTISAPWVGQCRRCLRPIDDPLTINVDERYAENPVPEDDAFPIERRQIDLAPMVREHILLAADESRLCRDDCPGLCPVCGADLASGPCTCDAAVIDERWAVLDQLRES
jgi:uncharacterized protein